MKLNEAKIKSTDFLKCIVVNDLKETEHPMAFIQEMYNMGVKKILAGVFLYANEYKVKEKADGNYLDCAVDGKFLNPEKRTRIKLSEFFIQEEETGCPSFKSFCPKMGDRVFDENKNTVTYFGFVQGNHFYIKEGSPNEDFLTIFRGGEPQEFLELNQEEAIRYISMTEGVLPNQIKIVP
jgi:hypothetical protein